MEVMKLDDIFVIAGLGNPGTKYSQTRHNIGFVTVDEIAFRHNIQFNKVKFKACYGEGTIAGKKVILVKPQTFMNESGEALREILEWYRLPIQNMVVIYDDIDIDPGKIRIRESGSAGTHNGMRSVIFHVRSQDFIRVRIGVGRPDNPAHELVDYVLGKFPKEQHPVMLEAVKKAADFVQEILKNGTDSSINMFNKTL